VPSDPSSFDDLTRLVHVGRQALYDRAGAVAGYELLFRASGDAVHASADGAQATSRVIVNAFTEFGLASLVGQRLAFVNLTRDFLVGDLPVPFPPQRAVLEVLETVAVEDEVVAGVAALARRGYAIALDDFVWGSGHERLLDLAAYVKLDVLDADPAAVAATVVTVRRHGHLALVAERVETSEHLGFARELGFELFQGYALGRPQVLSTAALSPSRLHRVGLLERLVRPDVELDEIAAIVNTDASLSYRTLRLLNSAAAGLPRSISSVREAISLLGTARLSQWLSLMVISDGGETTEEQLSAVMIRARLCQVLADSRGHSPDAAFTVGMLSGVSDRLAVDVPELVGRLPLTEELVAALVDRRGPLGDVLATTCAYEAGDPAAGSGDPLDLPAAYLAAVDWAERICEGLLGD
jgi:c-di-GMP-related signal transduction protein